jgi:hypothetical protein
LLLTARHLRRAVFNGCFNLLQSACPTPPEGSEGVEDNQQCLQKYFASIKVCFLPPIPPP